jgi:hypothetical protein
MSNSENIITLTKEQEIPNRKKLFWKRTFKYSFFLIAFILVSVQVAKYTEQALTWSQDKVDYYSYRIKEHFKVIEYRPENGPSVADLDTVVRTYSSKYGVSPAITWAIVDQESNLAPTRIRFEESWKTQYSKKYPKQAWMNDIEYDLQFSSFGLMQVSYIIWKDFCGIENYTDLLSTSTNLDCGLKIISQCLYDRREVNPKSKRLRECFREYNGTGTQAEKYASQVMARLADHLIDDAKLVEAVGMVAIKLPQTNL